MLDSTGITVTSYEYDPFGNIITATGIMAEANPLRYRGYYYDRETGFYYLNSRYYDPKIGRFINADSYVSTGQGIVGYNMFAYCGNNPVNASDPEGHSWILALLVATVAAVAFSGCSDQPAVNVGAATPYIPSDSLNYNCYAHALGEVEWKYVGGSPGAVEDFSVDNVAEMVLLDAQRDGRTMRIIDSFDSQIANNEYRIALRTGESDYHFMVQHSDGSWSHKPGFCSTRLISGENPSVISWDAPQVDSILLYYYGVVKEVDSVYNYYNSKTIYFAVTK